MNVEALFDNSSAFDVNKVRILDSVFEAMTSGNNQKVKILARLIKDRLESPQRFSCG